MRYSQQTWHCKLAERLAAQHRWRSKGREFGADRSVFERITDRSWAGGLDSTVRELEVVDDCLG
jgi:hypothetical protein